MKFWTISIITIVSLTLFSGGCASIATGKYQEIPITSEPEGAIVKAGTGESITTPGTFKLKRNKPYTVVAEHECCPPQETMLDNRISNWFWGNAILGGGIGAIIDISNGSCDELFPKKVHFDFSPEGQKAFQRRISYLKEHPDLKEKIRWAISNGIIVKKMSKEQVIAAAGQPDKIEPYKKKYERYVYNDLDPKYYLFNKKGILKKTKKD